MNVVAVLAPVSGRIVPLEIVADPIFAQKMLGDGLAIDPTTGVAVAPIAGQVIVFHGAGHAYAIQAGPEVTVLVHLGLDTVQMQGEGFTRLVEVGDTVTAGQEVARFDLDAITAAGHSTVVPVIAIDLPEDWRVVPQNVATVRAGEDVLFTVERQQS